MACVCPGPFYNMCIYRIQLMYGEIYSIATR